MSLEGCGVGLGKLRAGAALALVLAAGGPPAFAQTAPGSEAVSAPADDTIAADPTAVPAEDQARDHVFVMGRKLSSSIATLPDPEDAPQMVNVISGETLQEQGVASLEQALRN